MTEATTSMTPAPEGLPTNPTSSPVNSQSASSKANQQAAAAGEQQGLTNKDAEGTVTDQGTTEGTPQAPAAPEPVSLDPKPRFSSSGNEHIDQVANLIANSGVKNAEALVNEVVEGKALSLSSKAELVEEFGADIATLVINQLETAVSSMKKAGEVEGARLKDYAAKRFGSTDVEGTWVALQNFAHSPEANLSLDDRRTMNTMLEVGGLQAEMVINSLGDKYKQSTGYSNPPMLMQGDGPSGDGFQPMSKVDYQQQIGPAIVKYGEASQEVQALRNRRAISISRGVS